MPAPFVVSAAGWRSRALADAIEDMGHTVLTRHLLDYDADASEAQVTERAVFERDMRWLALPFTRVHRVGSGSSRRSHVAVG